MAQAWFVNDQVLEPFDVIYSVDLLLDFDLAKQKRVVNDACFREELGVFLDDFPKRRCFAQ